MVAGVSTCGSVSTTRDPRRPPAVGHRADATALAEPELRLLFHLDLGDQPAGGRIPAGELDAGRLADHAATAVAPDEILAPAATGRRTARRRRRRRPARSPSPHVPAMIGTPSSPTQPARMRSNVVLPQREPVVVPGGKVADVERDRRRSSGPASPAPPRGTDRRCHADRAPRSCVQCRPPARELSSSCVARRSTMATSIPRQRQLAPPTSARSGRLPRSPPSCRFIRATKVHAQLLASRGAGRGRRSDGVMMSTFRPLAARPPSRGML